MKKFIATDLLIASLYFFIVSIFCPVPQVNNIAIILTSVVWLAGGNFIEKWNILKQRKTVLAMLLFMLLQALSILYSQNRTEAGVWLERRLALIILPLVVGSLTLNAKTVYRLLLSFALATIAASVLGIGIRFFDYLQTHDSGYFYNDNICNLFNKQAVYFAIYVNLSIYILVYLLYQNFITTPVHRNLSYMGIFLLLVVNYLLASRVSIAIIVLAVLSFGVYTIIAKKQLISGLILLMGLLVMGVLAVKLFPKTIKRFESISNAGFTYNNKNEVDHFNGNISTDNWNSLNTRLAVWSCAKEIIKANVVFGVGIGDVNDQLQQQYQQHQFYLGINTQLNAHNQYLDILISLGIMGFLLFFTAYVGLPFYESFKTKNYLALLFVLTIALCMVTEVMLNRNQGIVFIGFFLPFLLYQLPKPQLNPKLNPKHFEHTTI